MRVAHRDQVADGQAFRVLVNEQPILITLVNGVPHAIADACPHRGAALSDGVIRDGCVTCPGHFWRFSLVDGTKQGDPVVRVPTYACGVEDDWITVDVPPAPSARSMREVLLASARMNRETGTTAPSRAPAQGLLLDVGVVFFKSAWEIADEYERIRGLPAGTVVGRGPFDPQGDDRWQRYLEGEATEREYWLDFAATAVARGAPLDGHPTLMRAMFHTPGIEVIRPEARHLVALARSAGRSLGILTNELMDFQGRDWVEAQDWFPYFPVIVDSSEFGIRKPDPRPYLSAIEQLGLPADAIVFIDDNPTYVEGGRAVGLRSILLDVRNPDAAFREAAAALGLAY